MNKYIIGAIIVAAAGAVGYVSSLYFGKDNAIEEACETIIQTETGSNVDLSGPDEQK
ncbi:MAG: hypothetical protein LLG04_18965 [Parachlamydia sp.]|nr:hypothetical protein [Parachlamydia sp.]